MIYDDDRDSPLMERIRWHGRRVLAGTSSFTGYSRPLVLAGDLEQVEPGDQVNLANDDGEPYWVAVVDIGGCGEDPDDDSDHCDRDGNCLGVLTLEPVEPGDPRWWWHIQPWERLTVRVPCAEVDTDAAVA